MPAIAFASSYTVAPMGLRRLAKFASKSLRAGRVPPVAVVVSRYNASITDRLLDGAMLEYASHGGRGRDLLVIDAPGSFELPVLALAAAETQRFSGIVALGCIIKGETMHDRVIADAIARGLIDVTLATGVPVAFGVLTVDTPEQAEARAGGTHGNKGQEGMSALLDTIGAMTALALGQEGKSKAVGSIKSVKHKPDKTVSSKRKQSSVSGGAAKSR